MHYVISRKPVSLHQEKAFCEFLCRFLACLELENIPRSLEFGAMDERRSREAGVHWLNLQPHTHGTAVAVGGSRLYGDHLRRPLSCPVELARMRQIMVKKKQ